MYRLRSPLDPRYIKLIEPLSHNLSSLSIYRGLSDVDVFTGVDDSWLVTRVNHRILVSGNYSCSEALKAVKQVVKDGAEKGLAGFVIYYPVDAEDVLIGEHIEGVTPYPNWRNYYRLTLPETPYKLDPPKGYSLHQVTPSFLESDYTNINLVTDEMLSERSSLTDFLEKSFAYCAVYESSIVSWCMSEYNVDGGFEIGIETHEDHRRKGLAVQTARALLNHGIMENYRYAGWHCWKKNLASNITAERLGFKHVLEYPVEYIEVE